jgi:polyphosphate kinase 2
MNKKTSGAAKAQAPDAKTSNAKTSNSKASKAKTSDAKTRNATGKPAFDLENPLLPDWVEETALSSGGYPYDKKLKRKAYERDLRLLQIELLKMQSWMREMSARVVVLVEGRDAAGKGSSIKRFMAHLNPRHAKHVALPKPTEAERGQWYFQRYLAHLPAGGDLALFERSWYNRAGVEPVMGFCTPEETAQFLREAPALEAALIRDGMYFFKFWLSIGRATQLARFHSRRHDPLKRWKLTEIDLAAIGKWDAYSDAAEEMFRRTHTDDSPWTVIRANDKRRTRLEMLRAVLGKVPYAGKDDAVISAPDPLLAGAGPEFFAMPRD